MIIPLQFFDPAQLGPYSTTAVLVAIYFMLDRRIRRVENQINRLLGEDDGRRQVKR